MRDDGHFAGLNIGRRFCIFPSSRKPHTQVPVSLTRPRYDRLSGTLLSCAAFILISLPCRAEQLPLKLYQTSEGLSNNWIQGIHADSRGFIWFLTREGLTRFDGTAFVTYGTEDGLTESTVIQMAETGDGNYLVTTNRAFVCILRPGGTGQHDSLFSAYPLIIDSTEYRGGAIYRDTQGTLWAGLLDGLMRIHTSRGVMEHFRVTDPRDPEMTLPVSIICDDGKGSLWLGTPHGVVRFIVRDGSSQLYTLEKTSQHPRIEAISVDSTGKLWIGGTGPGVYIVQPEPIGSSRGAWKINRRQLTASESISEPIELHLKEGEGIHFTSKEGLSLGPTLSTCLTRDGRMWIATTNGLTVFDGTRFRTYTMKNGLCSNNVRSLATDSDGNLWIGTNHGVQKLSPNGLISFDEHDGIPMGPVHALYEESPGRVSAVVDLWNISHFNGERFQTVRPQLPQGLDLVWLSQAGFRRKNGEWWLPTSKGILRYGRVDQIRMLHNARPVASYTQRDGLPGGNVFRLYEDKAGNIWVSLWSERREEAGTARWDRTTGTFKVYSEEEGLPPHLTPTAFCEDSSGNLWISFLRAGLARFADGRFRYWTPSDGVPGEVITSLCTDRSGRLWVGSSKQGVHILNVNGDSLEWTSFTTDNGLASNNIRCLVEDHEGRMYAGTVRGIDRIDPSTGVVTHFSQAEGLANEWVVSGLRDAKGQLWFGTMYGLSRLDPREEQPAQHPPVYLSALRVNGVSFAVSALGTGHMKAMDLEHSENNIGIDFFSVGHTAGGPIRYQYRLSESSDMWSSPILERTINFASLSPGTYDFAVRAVSPDGVASLAPATVEFRILAPFWERWWFYGLVACSFAAALFFVRRRKVEQLRKEARMQEELARQLIESQERERKRIAAELHDSLGQDLLIIRNRAEIGLNPDGNTTISSEQFQAISDIALQAVENVRHISHDLRPYQIDRLGLTKAVQSIINKLAPVATPAFAADISSIDGLVPESSEIHIYRIVQEGVNNILKHSGATEAHLSIRRDNHTITITIRDNGKGFKHGHEGLSSFDFEGLGIRSIYERARILNGTCHIESAVGSGTTLSIHIPIQQSS